MTLPNKIAFVGLGLTLVGAALLFFYGYPFKKYHNAFIGSNTLMIADALPSEREVSDAEAQRVAATFQKRARLLNRVGFALVAAGTALQMWALCVAV